MRQSLVVLLVITLISLVNFVTVILPTVRSNVVSLKGLRTVALDTDAGRFNLTNSDKSTCCREESPTFSIAAKNSLWTGIEAIESNDLCSAEKSLTIAGMSRPWDLYAKYTLAQVQETCQNREALGFYAAYPELFDNADRYVDFVDGLLDRSPEAVSLNDRELLEEVIRLDQDDIWARVLLASWGIESEPSAQETLKKLRFSQLLPEREEAQNRAFEAIRIATKNEFIDSALVPHVVNYWSLNGKGDWAETLAVESPATYAPTPLLSRQIDYRTKEGMSDLSRNCDGWHVTNRSQPYTAPKRRYEDGEFTAISLVSLTEGKTACWLQGLWANKSTEFLAPSIMAEKEVQVRAKTWYRIEFQYATSLESDDFRLTAFVLDQGISEEPHYLIRSANLPRSAGKRIICEAFFKSEDETVVTKLGIRLWTPGSVLIEEVAVDPMTISRSSATNAFECKTLSPK